MAGIKQPIQDIITLLEAVSGMQYVRVWNDQFKKLDEGKIEAFPFPCAFVEVVGSDKIQLVGGGVAAGDLTFRIHIGHEQLDAGDGTMGQNLDAIDFKDLVVKKLALKKLTACTILQKSGESQNYDHGNVYIYTVDFNTHFFDSKGSPYDPDAGVYIDSTPPTTLELTVEKVNSL
jgi:hypothetical protein